MAAFAFYRLPYKDSYTLVMQNDDDPEKLSSVDELNGKSGFVIAPFMPSEECPDAPRRSEAYQVESRNDNPRG